MANPAKPYQDSGHSQNRGLTVVSRRRHFEGTENAELRAKIDEAKRRLPLPDLMAKLGLGEHATKTALCPFHDDQHPSFSVFQKNGAWFHRCFVGCSSGDEIAFLVKQFGISRRESIRRYLEMAGFPTRRPESREYPEPLGSPESPESRVFPVYPVSPVSEGQSVDGEVERELRVLAARNACTCARDVVAKNRFKLARDVSAFEKQIGEKLSNEELVQVLTEWHRLSQPFLNPKETRNDHLTEFLAELQKVRVPTGEGALTKALENVEKLSLAELPMIPGYPGAPENWRRLAALHRELSRLCGRGIYFLSYRDAAKAYDGLSHQEAHTITLALARLGVIKIESKGKAGLKGREAAEFRYLLPGAETARKATTELTFSQRPRARAYASGGAVATSPEHLCFRRM